MARMTIEITTNANGVFNRTTPFNPPGPFGLTIRLSATLLSPRSTGLWGTLDIDAKDGNPSNQKRAFVAWHNEVVQLGSWRLDGGDNVVVVKGITKPKRPNTRLVLQIDSA